MSLQDFVCFVFTGYALTLIIASSHIARPARRAFRWITGNLLPWGMAKGMVQWEPPLSESEEDQTPKIILEDHDELDLMKERDIQGYDMISCRMCVGFWVCLLLFGWTNPLHWVAAVYGASYFLATQEK